MQFNIQSWIGSLHFVSGVLEDYNNNYPDILDMEEYFNSDDDLDDLYGMKSDQGPYRLKNTYRQKRFNNLMEFAALLDQSTTEDCEPELNFYETTECDPMDGKPPDRPEVKKTEKNKFIGKGKVTETNKSKNVKPPQTERKEEKKPPPVVTCNPIVTTPSTANKTTSFQNSKAHELHELIQHLYIAQARVQLEAIEIKKAQFVANSAQQSLEEAANHVRAITGALQSAQQEVASAAIRAQTAQLQLAAHDQLLFAARQDVDALSSQMVGLQAAEGITAPKVSFDVSGLLDKLKQPLPDSDKPTAIPPICTYAGKTNPTVKTRRTVDADDFYEDVDED